MKVNVKVIVGVVLIIGVVGTGGFIAKDKYKNVRNKNVASGEFETKIKKGGEDPKTKLSYEVSGIDHIGTASIKCEDSDDTEVSVYIEAVYNGLVIKGSNLRKTSEKEAKVITPKLQKLSGVKVGDAVYFNSTFSAVGGSDSKYVQITANDVQNRN